MKARFKKLVEQNRWLRYVPNSLTLCNSLCGFAAILYTLRAYEGYSLEIRIFAVSAWIILCAMVFDALDGFAARIFNAASMHGIQMDSLADMVTFGVAPATLVAIFAHKLRGELMPNQELLIYLLCSVYLGGAALRLATYNVHATLKTKSSSDRFSGLPSPGAAAALCVAVLYLKSRFGTDEETLKLVGRYLPFLAAFLGLMMTSKVPYIHAGKWLMSIRRNRKKMPLVLVAIAILICFRMDGLAFLTGAYIVSGPVLLIFEARYGKKSAEGEN